MLHILRDTWYELSGNLRRTLALTLGPFVLVALGYGLDLVIPRANGTTIWGTLVSLPVAAWLSANWMAAPGVDDPASTRLPALAAQPLVRSLVLSLLVSVALVAITLPFVLARVYLVSLIGVTAAMSLWPSMIANWIALVAISVVALWLWLRLASAFEAAATGTPYGIRQAFAATRPQARAILGVSFVIGFVMFVAENASAIPTGTLSIWLQAGTTGLILLITVVMSRVVASRVMPQTHAEIFA